jgi:hypothetical protein
MGKRLTWYTAGCAVATVGDTDCLCAVCGGSLGSVDGDGGCTTSISTAISTTSGRSSCRCGSFASAVTRCGADTLPSRNGGSLRACCDDSGAKVDICSKSDRSDIGKGGCDGYGDYSCSASLNFCSYVGNGFSGSLGSSCDSLDDISGSWHDDSC